MPVITRRELLEAGVHFGHQTKRWNPKMRRYLFGQRSGIYIIDLEKTLTGLEDAYAFVRDIGSRNGVVLFVGTKKQAQDLVAEQATRVGMPYVNTRWLGGMLTNFQTMSVRLKRLKELREMERSGAFEFLPKKEVLKLRHEKEKLERNLAGLQDLERLPDAIFVIDTKKEHIAVTEARKLGVPVVAIVDTNCDPDEVDFVIPGNDDAIRACNVVTRVVADAIQEGQYMAYQRMQARAEPEFEREAAPAPAALAPDEEARRVTLSAEEAAWMGASLEEESAAAATGSAAATDPAAGGAAGNAHGAGGPGGTEPSPPTASRPSASEQTHASTGWPGPRRRGDEESRTVQSLSGPADPEGVESAVENAPVGPEAGRSVDETFREGVSGQEATQVRAGSGRSEDADAFSEVPGEGAEPAEPAGAEEARASEDTVPASEGARRGGGEPGSAS